MHKIDVPIWNATVANLTLMALGSSAPEILLSVIETLKNINEQPGELGPSTIVGSAAFNLLVITGVSILAVGEEVKPIYDVGVFAVTSIFSIWAYVWMFICLKINGANEVSLGEAWATLAFFFILIIFAYTADKINKYLEDARKS